MTTVDGWIKWTGGPRPVAPDAIVDIIVRIGFMFTWGTEARDIRWAHEGNGGDVLAYRVHRK